MGIYTSLVSNILFPIHEKLKRHDTVDIRRAMDESQWWPAEKLERLQVERLRALLAHVGQNVPYYRNLLNQLGIDPQKFEALADLQRLPFLTKAIIRREGDGMKSDIARDLSRFNTGGSSGEPLIFFIGAERVSHDVAAKWRATRWWGVDIGDPEVVVWGSPIELSAQDYFRKIRDFFFRTALLPAFEMSESRLDGFIASIRSKRPKMLFGYPSALSLIARHAEQRGIRMDNLGIKVAFVTSERLYPEQRETISRIFNCPVANGYGGRDAGFIAHECPNGGMHITAEDVIVEIINEAGEIQPAGVAGEIVVTHLATRDFPFIRYRTGDIGILSTEGCACGRGLPLLKEIQGRSTDFLVAADGTVMHGLSLIYILRDLPGIRAFKIIQETRTLTRALVVVDTEFKVEFIDRIVKGFQRRLGEDVAIEVETVDEIPPEKSGKYRYVVSHVVRH